MIPRPGPSHLLTLCQRRFANCLLRRQRHQAMPTLMFKNVPGATQSYIITAARDVYRRDFQEEQILHRVSKSHKSYWQFTSFVDLAFLPQEGCMCFNELQAFGIGYQELKVRGNWT
jgi:hypothetical protein